MARIRWAGLAGLAAISAFMAVGLFPAGPILGQDRSVAPPTPPAPAGYVKQADPQATWQAYRSAVIRKFSVVWHAIGPFESPEGKGLDAAHPPEQAADLTAKYPGLGGEKSWQPLNLTEGVRVGLSRGRGPGPNPPSIYYVLGLIESPEAGEATLTVQGEDPLRLWFNGQVRHDRPAPSLKPVVETIPLKLSAGRNLLLVKVLVGEKSSGSIGLALSPPDASRLPGALTSFMGSLADDFPQAAQAVRQVELEVEALLQYSLLGRDLKVLPKRYPTEIWMAQAFNRQSLIHPTDRDQADVVLRRTAALLEDIGRMEGAADLSATRKELDALKARNSQTKLEDADARYALYADACRLRRRITLANPLLDFDKLLFAKHHWASYDHMCDQYYGHCARAGGGICVLSDPFGAAPSVKDILADSTVTRGRLAGQKLVGGSFLSPELSFDARQVLFAYVELKGGAWTPGGCYHLFKANIDGTGLEQLTDGEWNEFDPCWLPNDKVVFVSERRGGFLRCGRHCPVYTMHRMDPDGSNIERFSDHETHEWHPSLTNDGRLVYTRWDYVDRSAVLTHLPWVCSLDGRDPRAIHGNYPMISNRPQMELNIRAIPGSHKFVATAAGHHHQAFGSLVVFDPDVLDDNGLAPVRRLTPDALFPETEGGELYYGTPWPLSEHYFLAAYDGTNSRHQGLYLVDAFGNKELIYRDYSTRPQDSRIRFHGPLPSIDPMPLRPRPKGPAVPTVAGPGVPADAGPDWQGPSQQNRGKWTPTTRPDESAEAVLAVANVYESSRPWPPGTRIAALRIIQILPKTNNTGGRPAIGISSSSGSGAGNARAVLGAVPVEADGSAYFRAPADKAVYFQALDERGLAVQSMLSLTYAKKGETLVCAGCHANRWSAPKTPASVPLAFRRAPSQIAADVQGSRPFSYPRLVQPVLDRHCADCHAKEPAAPKLGGAQPATPTAQTNAWTESYVALAVGTTRAGGYVYRNSDPVISLPGRFGARASKLLKLLDNEYVCASGAKHPEVKLPPEDLHRLTLWMDCLADFFGAYENTDAQARGEIVRPTLE